MKRGATAAGDSPSRSGKKTKKPRAKGSETTARSGDYELDLNRFPDKLRWLLDNETAPEALWWLPEGDAIGIRKTAFQEQLLVQEFRGNKFSSITRKLNRWGFRRVDDEERVSEGAIAYSHDFFLRDNVAMMRFMKKEEDRKQNEAEEDAKTSEETRTSSLRSLLGEGQPQPLHPRHLAAQLRLGHAPHLGNLGLSSLGAGSLFGGPSAPLHSSIAQHQLRANLFGAAGVPSSQLLQGNAAALAAFTSAQFPALQSTSTDLSSLRNQLTTIPAQQQLLLEERHQQLLLEERQQQLRRISAAGSLPRPVTNLSIDPAQALLRRGSHLDSALLSLPGQVSSSLDPALLAAATATTQSQNADLLGLRRSFDGNRRSRTASISSAPELARPDLASLDPTTDVNRALLLQQHEQIEQERLLQLRQQLSQPGPQAVASLPVQQPGAATAGNLSLSNQMYLLAQAEQEKQEKQQQQGR